MGVPRSVGFWRFFSLTFAEELLSTLYSEGFRIKIRHLWWIRIMPIHVDSIIANEAFNKLVRHHAVLVYSFNFFSTLATPYIRTPCYKRDHYDVIIMVFMEGLCLISGTHAQAGGTLWIKFSSNQNLALPASYLYKRALHRAQPLFSCTPLQFVHLLELGIFRTFRTPLLSPACEPFLSFYL